MTLHLPECSLQTTWPIPYGSKSMIVCHVGTSAKGDLAICSPLREGDILFAEACRERKADVRLLVLDVPMFSGSNSSNWENRYQELASVAENWRYKEELGDPLISMPGRATIVGS